MGILVVNDQISVFLLSAQPGAPTGPTTMVVIGGVIGGTVGLGLIALLAILWS